MNQRVASQRITSTWDRCVGVGDTILDEACDFIEDTIYESRTCPQCDGRVNFSDRYCPTCDQAFPLGKRWKAAVLMLGVPTVFAMVLLVLMS